jgi:hypothetical protein
MTLRRLLGCVALLSLMMLAQLLAASWATASDYYWIGTEGGDWTTPDLWSPPGPPTDGNAARFASGTTQTVNYNSAASNVTLSVLDLYGVPGATVTLSQVASSTVPSPVLRANDENIGASGSGVFSQSAGTNTVVGGSLRLGYFNGTNGVYDLSGAGTLAAPAEYVGSSGTDGSGGRYTGTGQFTQTGGTNTVGTALYVGFNPASTGTSNTYALSSGTLSAPYEYLGYYGAGGFAQSGGSNTVSSVLYLGFSSTAMGIYDLSGSASLSAPTQYIGLYGTGRIAQSGGTNTAGSGLYLGYYSGSNGTYDLSGTGQLSAPYEYVGSSGSSGSTRYTGTGQFTQTGGTNTVGTALYVGYNPAGGGKNNTYTLGSGTLSAPYQYIGYYGTGRLTQSGGTNAATTSLALGYNTGSDGTYELSGTGALTANQVLLGYNGTGTFVQTGGTNTVNNRMWMGYNSGSTGSYRLDSGTLASPYEYIGFYGSGTFTQSGGADTAGSALILGYYDGSNGTYDLGGTGQLFTPYEYVGSSASSGSTRYTGTGQFTQTGGTNTVGSTLYIGYNPGAGNTYTLNSGTLIAPNVYIGLYGTGTFTQSGGSHSSGTETPSNSIILGHFSGSSGTYQLSGTGTLSADFLTIGNAGTGTFRQTGGSVTVNTTLCLGYAENGSGRYELGGAGTLNSRWITVGYQGTSTFSQTGGSITNDEIYLGYTSTGRGTYELSGTGMISSNKQYVGIAGNGTFKQSGGTNTVSDTLYVGNYLEDEDTHQISAGTGTYELSGTGSLNSRNIAIGDKGTGTFRQTGGTNIVSDSIAIGSGSGGTGTYLLEGGLLDARSVLNFGTLVVTGGEARMAIENHGLFEAAAPIVGNVTNQGTMNMGSSIVALAITGDFAQAEPGLLFIKISDGANDFLGISGNALLGGTLDVDLLDGFLPSRGSSFDILHADATLSGIFSLLDLPVLPDGERWNIVYGPHDVFLDVTTSAPVPVPSTLLLMAAGLFGLGLRLRWPVRGRGAGRDGTEGME